MKFTLLALLSLTVLFPRLSAQVVPLFSTGYDSTCLPYTPITTGFIMNDALSYSWNFGNGTTINQKNPNYSYTQAGTFKLSLTIATNATDKMVTGLTITEIPNTWDDRGNKDTKPDLYFVLKDSAGAKILTSNIIWDMFPSVTFKTNFLLKTGKNYTVELWEDDEGVGTNDLLAYIPINGSATTNTFSNGGGTIVIASSTNNTSYTQSKNILLYNQPTVNITTLNSLLTANVTGGIGESAYSYRWRLNGNSILDGYEKTYKPIKNGDYSVLISSSNCTATSPIFKVIGVGAEDLPILKNVQIYPTPSVLGEKKWLSIHAIEAKTVEIEMTDISGKAINHQNIDLKMGDNTVELPIINASGIYFIRLLSESKTIFLGKTTVF